MALDKKNREITTDTRDYDLQDGMIFRSCVFTTTIADSATMDFNVEVGDTDVEINLVFISGGESMTRFYENAVVDTTGTAAVFGCANRNSTTTIDLGVFTGSVFTTIGSVVCGTFTPGGSKNSAVGAVNSVDTYVLKANSVNLFAMQNISGGAIAGQIIALFKTE